MSTSTYDRLHFPTVRKPKPKRKPKKARVARYWSPDEIALLGTITDIEVGKRIGISDQMVFVYRNKLGIPAYSHSTAAKK